METNKPKVVAIIRETKNCWERRTPLVPNDVKKLVDAGIKVLVQPDPIRCFSDEDYKDAGAEISEDISSGDILLAIKEVPLDLLFPSKTYIFYSHTVKGQSYNMPLLNDIIKKNIRLFDYELLGSKECGTGISSSRFAGLVGGIDLLQGIGEYLLFKRYSTPFLFTSYAYQSRTLEDAKTAMKSVGDLLSSKCQLPKKLCPFVIAITSKSRVSQGVQEILECLPHEYVDPSKIESLFQDKENIKCDRIYISVIEHKHMCVHKEKGTFDREDYYANPGNYENKFAERFIPYVSVIYNCMYWEEKFPRLLTLQQAKEMAEKDKFKLIAVSDITCDFAGGIELLQKFTEIESPFFLIDPQTHEISSDWKKFSNDSVLFHAVDHLPAELPIDSSNYLSEKLLPVVQKLLLSKYTSTPDDKENDLSENIINGCMTWNGKLLPKYEYLYEMIENALK